MDRLGSIIPWDRRAKKGWALLLCMGFVLVCRGQEPVDSLPDAFFHELEKGNEAFAEHSYKKASDRYYEALQVHWDPMVRKKLKIALDRLEEQETQDSTERDAREWIERSGLEQMPSRTRSEKLQEKKAIQERHLRSELQEGLEKKEKGELRGSFPPSAAVTASDSLRATEERLLRLRYGAFEERRFQDLTDKEELDLVIGYSHLIPLSGEEEKNVLKEREYLKGNKEIRLQMADQAERAPTEFLQVRDGEPLKGQYHSESSYEEARTIEREGKENYKMNSFRLVWRGELGVGNDGGSAFELSLTGVFLAKETYSQGVELACAIPLASSEEPIGSGKKLLTELEEVEYGTFDEDIPPQGPPFSAKGTKEAFEALSEQKQGGAFRSRFHGGSEISLEELRNTEVDHLWVRSLLIHNAEKGEFRSELLAIGFFREKRTEEGGLFLDYETAGWWKPER